MLLFTAMSATAFAADNVAKIGDTEYATLAAAVAAAQDGDTVTLLKDTNEKGIVVEDNTFTTGLIIDLANHSYTIVNPTVGSPGTETNGMQLKQGNTITIKNGKITSSVAKHLIQNYCNLTLDNVTMDGANLAGSMPYTVSHNNGTLTIQNGTKIIGSANGFALDVSEWGSYSGATATVASGCTITGKVELRNYTTPKSFGGKLTDGTGTEYTNGGIFEQQTNGTFALATVATVTTGTTDNVNHYLSLAAAVAAAQDGDTVTLLQNASGDGIQVPENKFKTTGLTINLNSYTYTISGKLVGSSNTENNGMHILDGNIVTIRNGTITSTTTATWGDTTIKNNKNPKGLTGARILIMNYATLNLTNVTLDGTNLQEQDNNDNNPYIAHYPITLCNNRATTTVTNCTINAKGENIGAALDTDKNSSDTSSTSSVTVIGSNVNGLVYVWDDNSSITAKATADGETSATEGEGYYRIANHKITKLDETYTITFDLDGGTLNGIGDPARYVFADGDKITLSTYVPTKPGYTFLGWFCYQEKEVIPDGPIAASINNDKNFNNPCMELVQITVLEVNRPVTIYAQWAQNTGGHSSKTYYNVMFDSNGGTKVATQSVRKNNTAEEPTAPTKSGYTFAGWFTDSKLTTAFDFDTKITKATKLYAKWTENTPDDTPGTDGTKTNTIILTLDSTTAIVFGETKQNDVAPLAIAGRVMMPTRFVAENLFCTVHWDKTTGIIKIKGTHFTSGEEIVITLTVGSSIATVNGETVKLDSTTFVQDNRIYTPLRFIAETLGATVDWNSSTKKITITLPATKIVEDIMAATDDAE